MAEPQYADNPVLTHINDYATQLRKAELCVHVKTDQLHRAITQARAQGYPWPLIAKAANLNPDTARITHHRWAAKQGNPMKSQHVTVATNPADANCEGAGSTKNYEAMTHEPLTRYLFEGIAGGPALICNRCGLIIWGY